MDSKIVEIKDIASRYGLGYVTISVICDRAEFEQYRVSNNKPKKILWNTDSRALLEKVINSRPILKKRLEEIKRGRSVKI